MNKTTHAVLIILVLALLAPASLFSAGARTVDPEEPTRITFWRTFVGVAAEAQEELVNRYNASQDKVIVDAEFQGFWIELVQKFAAALAARQTPDITTLDGSLMFPFARDGMFEQLDEFFEGPNGMDRSRFMPGMIEMGLLDGKQIFVPFAVSVPILYYNKDMLAEVGIDKIADTYDEFFDDIRKISDFYGEGVYGLSYEVRLWFIQSQIWAQGGEFSNSDFETFIDSDVMIAELERLRSLTFDEEVMIIPPKGTGGMYQEFYNQRSAMMIASSAQLANVIAQSEGFEVGAAHLPGGPAGRQVPLGGPGLVIPLASSRRSLEASWDFMKYMMSPEASAYFSSQTGYMPLTIDAAEAMEDYLQENPLWRVPINQLAYGRKNAEIGTSSEANALISEALERILFLNEDPKTILTQAQIDIQRALREEGLRN